MNSPWNGYGAIEAVRNKTADAPMAYRVLIPWLIGNKPTMPKYQALVVALMTGALYSVYLARGLPVMLITAAILPVTFFYDYWDWAAELIGFSLALVSLPLAALGVVIHGLSRETAPLAGLVYALYFRDLLGGILIALIGFAVLQIVRFVQGPHPLYCERWMYKRNWIELRKPHLGTPYASVALSALALVGARGHLDGFIVPVLVAAGWTMAVAAETRVFIAIIPYAAYALLKLA
jgi:hypothetical protein